MKKIALVVLAMLLYWIPADANILRIRNQTCSDFEIFVIGINFYGQVTVPANTTVEYANAQIFYQEATNTSGVEPDPADDFTGLRGWDVSPMVNSFFVNEITPFYAGWTLPCSGLSFNVVSNFPDPTFVDVNITP